MCHGKYPSESLFQKAKLQVNIYLRSDESKQNYSHHHQSVTAHNKQQIKYIFAPKDLLPLKIITGKAGIFQHCRWQASVPISTAAHQERKQATKALGKPKHHRNMGSRAVTPPGKKPCKIMFSKFMVL